MGDRELEALRRRRMAELRRLMEGKEKPKPKEEKRKEIDPKQVLNRFFAGRAWEVMNAAKLQHPQAARHIENTLVKLILEGRIRVSITGEELYALFRRLGLRIRLQTRIKIIEHGKIKSLEQKMKEETSSEERPA